MRQSTKRRADDAVALRETWYLWAGTIVGAVLTWIAVTFQNQGQSYFEKLLFGSIMVIVLTAAVTQLVGKRHTVDRFQASPARARFAGRLRPGVRPDENT